MIYHTRLGLGLGLEYTYIKRVKQSMCQYIHPGLSIWQVDRRRGENMTAYLMNAADPLRVIDSIDVVQLYGNGNQMKSR